MMSIKCKTFGKAMIHNSGRIKFGKNGNKYIYIC